MGIHDETQNLAENDPKGAHLALVTGAGTAIAIPLGAVLVIEPRDGGQPVPVALASVTRRGLRFKCPCGQKECTRWAKADLKWSGQHPSSERR